MRSINLLSAMKSMHNKWYIVKALHLCSAFLREHTDGRGYHARRQPAHQGSICIICTIMYYMYDNKVFFYSYDIQSLHRTPPKHTHTHTRPPPVASTHGIGFSTFHSRYQQKRKRECLFEEMTSYTCLLCFFKKMYSCWSSTRYCVHPIKKVRKWRICWAKGSYP